MAEDLANSQKRVLLAQMAQSGSAATAAYQQGQADIGEQRKAALAASIGESAKAGGVNDVGGLLDRRVASMEQGKQSRLGDINQRAAAYSGDLDLASAGNRSRVTEIDGNVATRRQELERAIASKRADQESSLAIMRMESDYKKRAIAEERAARKAERDEQNRLGREEATAKANSPESMASRLRALRYLENPGGDGEPETAQSRASEMKAQRYLADPDGLKEDRAKALREAGSFAGSFMAAADDDPRLAKLDMTPGRLAVARQQIMAKGYAADVVDEVLRPFAAMEGRPTTERAAIGGLAAGIRRR